MLCNSRIYDAIAQGSGFVQHGHTYLGHPVATAAGVAVVKEILERELVQQVRARGRFFEEKLREQVFPEQPYR